MLSQLPLFLCGRSAYLYAHVHILYHTFGDRMSFNLLKFTHHEQCFSTRSREESSSFVAALIFLTYIL